jgi:3-oxoacyl-[acyl-carrier-protein] synthase-3
MGMVVDQIAIVEGGWRERYSALRLAVRAARTCLRSAGRPAHDVDLLINAGIYRDRNMGEPALAALIQQDIGANPEDPHAGTHGTFSFDVANGSSGVLTALQIADGFFRSRVIDCALVVASDADPGRGISQDFPFSPAGGALLCSHTDDESGLGHIYWVNGAADSDTITSTLGLVDHRNVLRVAVSADSDKAFAEAAAKAAGACLRGSACTVDDVDAIVTAPARHGYRTELAARLGVPPSRITVADSDKMHTASLAAAFDQARRRTGSGARILLVAAGGGVTAGAALYRSPAGP